MKNLYVAFLAICLCCLTMNCSEKCVPLDNTCVCTKEYNPVCGCDDKTYGNPCEAECVGVTYTSGECK